MANINKSFNFRNGVQVDNNNFIVNPNGLVGIGTSIPREFLDVYGTAKVTGLVTTTNLYVTGFATVTNLSVGNVSISSGIVTASSGIVTYYGNGGNLLNLPTSQWVDVNSGFGYTSIYAAGNVGVATTNPIYTFQVGDNPNTGSGIGFNSTGSIKASGIITANSFDGSGTNITNINASNISSGILNNARLPSNISVSGILTATSGIVGGATSISGSLDVTGIATLRNQLIVGGATSISGSLDVTGIATLRNQLIVGGATSISGSLDVTGLSTFKNSIVGNLVGIASTARSLMGSPNISVGTIDSSHIRAENISATGIATITSDLFVGGNVGFGTSSPNTNLHLRKTGAASVQITSNTDESYITIGSSVLRSQNNGEIRFGNNSGSYSNSNSLDIVNYSTGNINHYLNNAKTGTGNFNWINSPNEDVLMTLKNGGELGIGITLPLNTLHVVGTSTVSNDSYVGNNFYVKNNARVYGNLQIQTLTIDTPFNGNINGNVYVITGISTFNDVNIGNNLSVNSKLAIGKPSANLPLEVGSTLYAGGSFVGIFTDAQFLTINLNAIRAKAIVGTVGVGTTAPTCAVDFSSAGIDDPFYGNVQRFMVPPKVTTPERNTLNFIAGALIYNTTVHRLEYHNGSGWCGIATVAGALPVS